MVEKSYLKIIKQLYNKQAALNFWTCSSNKLTNNFVFNSGLSVRKNMGIS